MIIINKVTQCWLACMLLMFTAQAQVKPSAENNLTGVIESLVIHEFSGIPIVSTNKQYIGLNASTLEELWKVDKKTAFFTKGLQYSEFPYTTIIYMGGHLVNVASGELIVNGEEEQFISYDSHHLFPSKDLLVAKINTKTGTKLYGINPLSNTKVWAMNLNADAGIKQVDLGLKTGLEVDKLIMKPFITKNGNLLYQNKKEMLSINPNSGEINWKKELEPGQVLLSPDGSKAAIAISKSGAGALMGMSTSKFGKKVILIDTSTGESIWKKEVKMDGQVDFLKPASNGFFVVHKEGMNIYRYEENDKPLWKKDLGEKDIFDVIETEGNLMVYTETKRQLFGANDGEKVWKKAEKLETEYIKYSPEPAEFTESGDYEFIYTWSGVRVFNKKLQKSKYLSADFYTYDERNERFAAVYNTNKDAMKIGKPDYKLTVVDLKTMTKYKRKITQKKGLNSINASDRGFFVSGVRGYQMVDIVDGKIEVIDEKHFPLPGSFVKGALSMAIGMGAASYGMSTVQKSVVGGDLNGYQHRLSTSQDVASLGISMLASKERSVQTNNYAFFFAKDDQDKDFSLYQIKKHDGSQYERYVFNVREPDYEVDTYNKKIYLMEGSNVKSFDLKD